MAPAAERGGAPAFETILYSVADAVATVTLNRPQELNTIVPPLPEEVEAAVELAVADPAVKVIVVRGSPSATASAPPSPPATPASATTARPRRRRSPTPTT